MRRSRGYFCKQSNVLEEAHIKKNDKFVAETLQGVEYKQKSKWRLIHKTFLRRSDGYWWMS